MMKTFSENWLGIPFKIQYDHSSLFPELFIAKSGIVLNYNGNKFSFFGASLHRNLFSAIKISKFEIMERLLASKVFYNANFNENELTIIDLKNRKKIKTCSYEEVLLTTKSPDGEYETNGNGSTGLSCHESIDLAIKHASLELYERHYRCLVWFNSYPVGRIKIQRFSKGAIFNFFTGYKFFDIPFVICISSEISGRPFFFIGSACGFKWNECIERSFAEALIHTETYFRNWRGSANTKDSRERYLTCFGESARKYKQHWENLIQIEIDSKSLPYCNVSEYLLLQDGLCYCLISEYRGLYVVRAIFNSLLNERLCRKKKIVNFDDPFC